MTTIRNHVFQRDGRTGELRLVIDRISGAPEMLCFGVSKKEPKGYLVRAETGDLYEITDIDSGVTGDAQRAGMLRVIEADSDGGGIARSYDLPFVVMDGPGRSERARRWCRRAASRASLFLCYWSCVLFDRGGPD